MAKHHKKTRPRRSLKNSLLGAAMLLGGLTNSLARAEQDLLIIHPENYQNMPSRFGSAAFDVGPYREVASPDPATFRSMHIPIHRDLPRFGAQDTYLMSNPFKQAEVQHDIGSRTAITRRMGDEAFLHLYLLLLQFGEAHLNDTALKFEKELSPGGPVDYYAHNYSYYPRHHVGVLANALTNNQTYLDYFCKQPSDCIPGNNRTPSEQSINTLAFFIHWGGDRQDPFRVREKYYDFVAKHLKTLIAWSKSLPKEAYVVGRTSLPSYDFARGGFPLQISFPKGGDSNPGILYYHESKTAAKFAHEPTYFDTLLKMSPEAAEALIEEIKANYGGNSNYTTVLFTMKVRFTNIGAMENNMLGLKALYELTEPSITLFKDEALEQQIAVVPL